MIALSFLTATVAAALVWRGTRNWFRTIADWVFLVLAIPVVSGAVSAFVAVTVFRVDYRTLSRDTLDMAVLAGNVVVLGYLAWLSLRRT